MTRRAWVVTAGAMLALAGCGGGGGGNSGSEFIGTEGGGGLTVSPTTLSFASTGGSTPTPRDLQVSWTSAEVAGFVAGFVAPVTDPGWLNVVAPSPCASPCTLTVSMRTSSMPTTPGTYTTTLTIITGKSDGQTPIGYRNVPIAFVRN